LFPAAHDEQDSWVVVVPPPVNMPGMQVLQRLSPVTSA